MPIARIDTPLYGLAFGGSVLAIGLGAVVYQKELIAEEITVQERHDGRSPELPRKTNAANRAGTTRASTGNR